MRIHWIWLATRPDLSDRKKRAVLEVFPDPEDAYLADEKAFADMELSAEELASLLDKNLTQAEKILEACEEKDIRICVLSEEDYPFRLKNIDDPPMVLYYRGQLPDFDKAPAIAAVGTRKASAYGLTAARQLGFQLVRCGAILVSGAADGIDGAAMEGALKAGGIVVGVLGNGADVVYPKCNRRLFEDTRLRGCLLSEFPPETPPYKWNFPKRNRIISGLCNGVLVVEAPARSGALITARQALEQGRDVFAMPGNVGVDTSEGTNELLRSGAILARDGWDVVEEYQHLYPETVRRYDLAKAQLQLLTPDREEPETKVAQEPQKPAKKAKNDKKQEKKPVDKEEKLVYSDLSARMASLSEQERHLVEKIENECLVDELIVRTGLPAGKVLAMLTLLEVRGFVKTLPGRRVKIKQ